MQLTQILPPGLSEIHMGRVGEQKGKPKGFSGPLGLLRTVANPAPIAYLEGMKVHFKPDLQARLKRRATEEGRNLDETVQDVVTRYFEEEDRFIEAVKRGEAALERGEFLTHEEVGDRLRRFLQP
jgi:predicted transcriptional regulator